MSALFLMISFLVTLCLVPIIRVIAIKFNFVDKPNGRKMHDRPKPLLGGVAIFVTIIAIYITYLDGKIPVMTMYFIGLASVLLVMGVIDDKYDMKAHHKLLIQILVAAISTYILGGISSIEIYKISIYFTRIQGMIIETIWFIVLINAFNLIDGLDGLSTGTAIFSFITILIMALITGDINNIVLLNIIIGSLLGFLFYNFYPSTIFLGDAGSMVIGYLIAILSINDYKTVTLTSMIFLLLIVFLPILDVTLSFIRRKVNGGHAFKADALHFHHRLMRRGYSHQKTVLVMYGLMSIYTVSAILISLVAATRIKFVIFMILIIITIVIFEKFYLLSDKYAFFYRMFKKIFRKG